MTKQTRVKLQSDQRGMVSIIVAVLMIIVLALIVLAMARNTVREQRQTLDRQLSDQAFYNAESGINDAAYYIYNTPTAPLKNEDCNTYLPGINNQVDPPNGVNKYTCLLYDKAPKSLQYEALSISEPKVIPIQAVDDMGVPRNISTITLSWDDASDRNGNISGACSFSSGSPRRYPPAVITAVFASS
jgi:hypothetical protein